MKAFNNDAQLKSDLIAEVIKHRKYDAIVKGSYGDMPGIEAENSYGDEEEDVIFKGCGIGCTIHSYAIIKGVVLDTSDHKIYEQFGIPQLLARLEDSIFEGLPSTHYKKWPKQFLSSIPVGADLSTVWPQFAQWLLTDKKWGVIQYAKTEQQRSAIQKVSDLYRDGGSINDFKIAYSAAAAADAAAGDAAAAGYAADIYAAYAAGYAAADAAAADAAGYTAGYVAGYAAKYKTRIAQSKKLISLLKAAK